MRTIKKKTNKKFTKKKNNLKGGADAFREYLMKLEREMAKRNSKGSSSASSKTKKTKSELSGSSKTKKTNGKPSGPSEKTKEEMRTEWIRIIEREAAQNEGLVLNINLRDTLNKKTDQLGLLQYDGENSCFIDSAIFGLLITRSETINNSLLTGRLLPIVNKRDGKTFNLLCKRCGITGDRDQEILLQDTARGSIRYLLKQIYTHIFRQRKVRKTLNEFNFRERFQSLELTLDFNFDDASQGESAEVIMLLLELFPIDDKDKIRVSKEKLYSKEETDLNLSIDEFKIKLEKDRKLVKKVKKYKGNSLPVYNLKYEKNTHEYELTYDINPTTIANHSRNFISEDTAIYLSNLLFEKDISNESETDSFLEYDKGENATNWLDYDWKSEKAEIICNGDVLIVQLRRDSMVRNGGIFVDTPVILDQRIEDSGRNNLFLSTIIVKSGGARGGHYKCFFRTGENFYLFNDTESTIKTIGNYEELMNINDEFSPTTRACICIYKKIKTEFEPQPPIIEGKIIPPEINKYLSRKTTKGTLTKIKSLTPEVASKKYSLDKTFITNAREQLKIKTNWTCDELMEIFDINTNKESKNREEGMISNKEIMQFYGYNESQLKKLKISAAKMGLTLHQLLKIMI